MPIKTGKGPISMIVVFAIWSLSLAVDLPGLAVTPIEGQLHSIFHGATDFQVQLLTVLPNVVIIPFVLLSGKLSETKHKVLVITLGTILYIIAGVLSMASKSLDTLIWLSCLLGAGCGLILPFSTGLIADVFVGKYRMKQMGIVSAIGNVALVGATFVVGFLAAKNWHLPFLVYLIPVVSLILIPFLNKIPQSDYAANPNADDDSSSATTSSSTATSDSAAKPAVANTVAPDASASAATTAKPAATAAAATATLSLVDEDGFSTANQVVKGGFFVGRTIWLLLAYFFFVFATSVPPYYLPNLMPQYHMSTEAVSIVTSVFYFAMFLIGLVVTGTLKVFRRFSFILAGSLVLGGFILFVFTRSLPIYIIASAIIGLGNGLAQPIFYMKATELVSTRTKYTLALAYLQVANYVAISLVPVIINLFIWLFDNHTNLFPFIVTGVMCAIVLVFIIIRAGHFTFGIHKQYYE